MDSRAGYDTLLTAVQCAKRIGLSVRALRLYEQHDLISPARTAKGWRLYGGKELARLNEILALKALGLSLRNISALLRDHPTDLGRTLALQRNALEQTRRRAERGLLMIENLRSKIDAGMAASVDDLVNLATETNMTDISNNTIAWRRYEQMRPREQIAIPSSLYQDYSSAYELEDGPYCIVSHRDQRLFYRIVGQSDIEIFPESDHQFFMKALPVQITFNRDSAGSVIGLTHHQGGTECNALRTDVGAAYTAEEEIQERKRLKLPMTDGETILRRLIDEYVQGKPRLDNMHAPLALLATEQADHIREELANVGALVAVSFKGVSQDGLDIYDVDFQHEPMEWGFAVTPRGKISHFYLRARL